MGRSISPWRQNLDQRPQNQERQDQKQDGRQHAFARREVELVCGVAEKTLREQLAADHDVPTHRKDAHHDEQARHGIDHLACFGTPSTHLHAKEQRKWHQRPDDDLQHDLRDKQLGFDHEVECQQRFVSDIKTVDQVKSFEREVDDKRVKEILRDGVDAQHVDRLLAQFGGGHVDEHHG